MFKMLLLLGLLTSCMNSCDLQCDFKVVKDIAGCHRYGDGGTICLVHFADESSGWVSNPTVGLPSPIEDSCHRL